MTVEAIDVKNWDNVKPMQRYSFITTAELEKLDDFIVVEFGNPFEDTFKGNTTVKLPITVQVNDELRSWDSGHAVIKKTLQAMDTEEDFPFRAGLIRTTSQKTGNDYLEFR